MAGGSYPPGALPRDNQAVRAGLTQASTSAGFAGNDEVGMSRYWHIR